MAYSKNKVDKAGQTLADYLRTIVDSKTTATERSPEVIEAVEIIDWWRGGHAKPLSRVAANLRYYAAEHEAPTVAQRLKKFPTIVDKLLRQPTMKLSRMADIGGVRAVLPNQAAAYAVASRLRKNLDHHQSPGLRRRAKGRRLPGTSSDQPQLRSTDRGAATHPPSRRLG